jgi:hypothetical protein
VISSSSPLPFHQFVPPLPKNNNKTPSALLEPARCSLLERLGHKDRTKRPWVPGRLREQIVDFLRNKASSDEEFEKSLALQHTVMHKGDHLNAAIYPKENCIEYLSQMQRSGTFGGEPELAAAAQLLDTSIIIFELMSTGDWRLSNHLNSTANQTLYLFRSNIHCDSSAHYDLGIPALPASELDSRYGQLLEAAMNLTHVQPVKITINCPSDLGPVTNVWLFGVPGDGNCLFNSIAMFQTAADVATQQRGTASPWFCTRVLSPLNQESLIKCKINQTEWSHFKEITDLQAIGGKGVYDETSIKGQQRLLETIFDQLPNLNRGGVLLDLGHGMAQTIIYSATSKLVGIGFEQDSLLHQHAKKIGACLQPKKNMALRFLTSSDLKCGDLEGVTVITMYESMAGRADGPNDHVNDVHMATILKILQTVSVQCFTSTKLQKKLLLDYCAKSTDIRSLMPYWIVVKVDGAVHRKGNNPKTYIFLRKSAVHGHLLPSVTPATSEFVRSMVDAAHHRNEGKLHTFVYDSKLVSSDVKSFNYCSEDGVLQIFFGFPFKVLDHLTGLIVCSGDTIDVGNSRIGVVVGFGSKSNDDRQLGLFLMCLPNGQHTIASQELLLRVVGNERMVLLQANFNAAKRFGKQQQQDTVGRRESSTRVQVNAAKETSKKQQEEQRELKSAEQAAKAKRQQDHNDQQREVEREGTQGAATVQPEAVKTQQHYNQRQHAYVLSLEDPRVGR